MDFETCPIGTKSLLARLGYSLVDGAWMRTVTAVALEAEEPAGPKVEELPVMRMTVEEHLVRSVEARSMNLAIKGSGSIFR